LLADDHRILREGLRNMLAGYPDVAVVAETSDGQATVEMAEILHPDVIVMDVNMPKLNGLEATRRIKSQWPQITVIALSLLEDEQTISAMREAGASAYFSKSESIEKLYRAIRTLATHNVAPMSEPRS
jgi:DNA-binding NarL/FixJ family response regulator